MKTKLKILTCFLLAALLITCATTSANYGDLGRPQDKVPLTSRALTGKLSNGLTYYILENSRPENRAYLALVVNAGAVQERDDQRGFAHFVEHLSYNGTVNFPEKEIMDYFRSLGMRFGAEFNAYTSYDETVYHFEIPVETSGGIKKIPDKALAILNDWTYAISILPEEVASESKVILEEFRTRLGASERVRKITRPIIYEGSVYADIEIIGLQEIIANATSEQLKEFYSRWYTPDNMALVFVGDFDGQALEKELNNNFTMPASQKPVNRPKDNLPPPKNGNFKVEVITDPELTQTNFSIYMKQKRGTQRGTLSYYRESIIDYLISTMLDLRFEEAGSSPESAAAESWGGIATMGRYSRFYVMGTQPKIGGVSDALRELLLEKESARRYGFTEGELERAKLDLLSYMERQLSEKDQQNSRGFSRGFISHFLTGEDMADIEWEVNAVNTMLAGIGLKEIQAAVKNYFAANDIILFLTAPEAEAENLPTKEQIKSIFAETANAKITAKTSASLSGELLDEQPVSGRITGEVSDRQTGAITLTLSNGAKVILKETTNKNNEIVLYAAANGGTANSNDNEIVSVNLASEMIAASGLGPYSRTELINKLAGKQASFSFWTSSFYRGFQGSSTSKDLQTLFEMIHLFFTKPQFDDNAVTAMLDQYRTNLAHQEDNPQRVFSREISRIINSNHPRFKPMELADMDKVSREQALAFIKKCVNPADYTFVFTGNINIEEMKELASVYLASIPPSVSMNKWTDPKITRPGKTEKLIYKGKEDKCSVYLGWFAPGPSAFDEAKNQTAAVLSEYLDILLTDEIREKLGGVYSIYAGASVSVIPNGEYRMIVQFQCDPARSKELITAVQDRLTEVATRPLSQDTFNKAKEALLMEHDRSMQSNLHIAQSYINSSVLYNTPLNRLNSRPDAIKAARMEDAQTLCRQMLAAGPVQVILYPEE